ncbi:hypothetical protein Tco_1554916 [Tanacetum coccineum]
MLDYGFNFMNTKIYIDNESNICIVKNPVFHSKTKHIAIRHHFIRDAYEKKLIQVLKIHTDDNVADLLTKAFDVSSVQKNLDHSDDFHGVIWYRYRDVEENTAKGGEGVDWTSHSEEEEEDYALMACNIRLRHRAQLSDASIEIQAYTQALKKVEAQLVAHQQGQLWYEEKIRFMKIDLDDKTDVLTYHKKLLAEAEKVKEDLKAKVEKWHNSSKNLGKLLNTQMSANDKFGLGYGDYRYDGILSYENEVLQSVFMNKKSDLENQPLYDRFVTAEGMHAVPPPMTGNYMPSGPDIEIDYSQFTYGPKQSQPSESKTQTSDFDTCESDCSVETHESLPEPTVNEPKVVSQPKVWSDAPIIEEYESDNEDEHVSLPTEEHETPSFANQQVKTPRETIKNQFTHSKNSKVDKKELGYGFTTKACFVCGSLSHLIRDCDFHEKRIAKQVELNKKKGKDNVQRENKLVWNNVKRVNHKNQFVPRAILTRTGNDSDVHARVLLGEKGNAVKPLEVVIERHKKKHYWPQYLQYNGGSRPRDCATFKDPLFRPHDWNKAYLADYQDFMVPLLLLEDVNVYITWFRLGVLLKKSKDVNCGILKDLTTLYCQYGLFSSTVKRSKVNNAGEEHTKHPDFQQVDKEDQVFLDKLERLKRQEQDANDAAGAPRKEFA